MSRLVLLSDTHGLHGRITVPDGDVLVHAGDFCNRGTLDEVRDFMTWFAAQPHRHKVVIAGNHDWPFQVKPSEARALVPSTVTYLQDRAVTIAGLEFYGMPWQPVFHDWAFNLPRDGWEMAVKVGAIPTGTQVLVTHGPPHGYGDLVLDGRTGCALLAAKVQTLPHLMCHVFGHIHEGYGSHGAPDGPWMVNASVCTRAYKPTNAPVVVEVTP